MKQPFNKNGSVLTDNAENSTKLLGEYAQYLQMLAEWCLCYMDKHQKLNLTQHDFVRLEKHTLKIKMINSYKTTMTKI